MYGGGGGGCAFIYKENNTFSFHIFFTFYAISNIYRKKTKFRWGGGESVSTKFVVLAAEPVGGRSRATELPCQN